MDNELATALSTKIANNVDRFLDHFGVDDLYERKEKLVGTCPIHCGDNRTAFNFWIEGDELIGNF